MEKTAATRKSPLNTDGESSKKDNSGKIKEDKLDDFAHQPGASQEKEENSVTPIDSADSLETCESAVNISETFITIETKNGQSSKKIPFSHFLKNMIVDKHSGNFTLNLEQFLDAQNKHTFPSHSHAENESLEPESPKDNKTCNNPPPKNSLMERPSSGMPAETNVNKVRTPDIDNLKLCQLNSLKPSDLADDNQSLVKNLNTGVPQAPRRSSRVPAKNKRFAQDFVNTLTLGKNSSSLSSPSSSSKSSWNTQLMTLALAAETHKNKPQGDSISEPHSVFQEKTRDLEPMEEVASQEEVNLIGANLRDSEEVCLTPELSPANTPKIDIAASKKRRKASAEYQIISAGTHSENVALCEPKSKIMKLDLTSAKPSNNIKSLKTLTVQRDIGKLVEDTMVLDSESAADHQINHSLNDDGKIVHSTATYPKDPNSSKKHDACTKSVLKMTLPEAMIDANEAARSDLSVSTPGQTEQEESGAVSSSHIYYAIMEPKTEAQGHFLLVKKVAGKTGFCVAEVVGATSHTISMASSSKRFPQDRLFSCEVCEHVFTSTSSWLQHIQSVHNQSADSGDHMTEKALSEIHQCEFCEQRFPYKFMLDLHIKRKRHSEMKHFRCTLCRENFSTHKAREEHWTTAHQARSCGLCGKQVDNIVSLRRHIGNGCHGARFRRQTDRLKGEATNEAMVFSFPGTDSNHKTRTEKSDGDKLVDKHIKSTAEVNEIAMSEKAKNIQEEIPNQEKSLVQPTGFRKMCCQVCSASFFTSSGLWKHMMEKHQQFYPRGFKERLMDRLDKNQTLLANTENALVERSSSNNKSKFFVVMNPKVASSKTGLSAVSEEKEFRFGPKDDQYVETVADNGTGIGTEESASSKLITFNCSQCKLLFSSASDYRDHCSKTHGECFEGVRLLGAFQCTLCSDSFPCQFMLDKHLKKHVGRKLLPCTLCGLQFHKIQERRQHWKSAHPGIGCPNCGKMYASIKYLQKHISLNCQDHFPPSKKFLEFQKKQHNDFEMDEDYKRVEKKILRCHLCPKICSSVHGWRRHMTEAHEDIGFSKLSNTCIICSELVYGYKALEKHILEKHAEDSGLPVEEENNLVEQAVKKSETDIKEYKAVGKNTAEITRDEFDNYQCPSCPKTHPDLRAIKTHMRTHVDMELECNQCGKTFKNPSLLKQHIQRHRKEAIYTCETCNKSFLTLLKLNKHCKVHHAKGNFVCELCGASFALNEYLQKHRKCHNDIRPHVCSVCAKTFRTKPELRVHFLIHTRETPHICQYCGRGFSQRGNYRTHLAQHTGVKPYQCDRCPLSFALKCHLTRHLATHDQLIQYRCLWCDKECTQRKHMQMHVIRVHQEDFIQHEEAMKLDTPTPIPESQARLYNRRPAKASKIRRQYRTKAEKCDTAVTDHPEMSSDSVAQMIVGLPVKSSPMEITASAEESIIHVVEGMEEQATVSYVVPEEVAMAVSHQRNGEEAGIANFEVLVSGGSSEDHQAYTKNDVAMNGAASTADLLLQENMQLVVGENNEISIIIKSEGDLHKNLVEHQGFESREVHSALQDAIAVLASHSHSQSIEVKEEDTGVPLEIGNIDKQDLGEDSHILNFVSESGEDL